MLECKVCSVSEWTLNARAQGLLPEMGVLRHRTLFHGVAIGTACKITSASLM